MASQQDINNQKEFNEELSISDRILQEIQKTTEDTSSSFIELSAAIRAQIAEQTKGKSIIQNINRGYKELQSITEQTKNEELGILSLNTEQVKKLNERAQAAASNFASSLQQLETELSQLDKTDKKYDDILKTSSAITAELKDRESSLNNIIKKTQERLDIEEKRLKIEKKADEALGIGGSLIDGIEKGLKKIGLKSLGERLGLDEARSQMRETGRDLFKTGEETVSFGDKFKVLGSGIGAILSSFGVNVFDPSVLFGAALNLTLQLDSKVADLAKNLNLSFSEAKKLTSELKTAAAQSGDIFITSKGLAESLTFINQTLGARVKINNEDLATFTKLREVAGLTNDEIMGITSLTRANGKSLEQNTDELLLQVSALNEASGIQINEKDILKDIGQISAATTLSLSKNPRLLADAAQTAKRLGLELSQVESIADSLLNFESSITNELEAEVLLGRDLNLERARLAALNNDVATVAREISSQVGDAAEFSKLNRIQQEALAQSVGMSREDLAKQLFVQEQLVGVTGDQAAARERLLNARIEEVGLEQASKEGIETLENQAGIQERINASVAKLATAFDGVAVALLPILDLFSDIFSLAGKLLQLIEPIIGLLGAVGTGALAGSIIPGVGTIGGAVAGGLGYALFGGEEDVALAEGGIVTKPIRALVGEAGAEAVIPLEGNQMIGADMKETNALLQTLVSQNSKKPELSPVGLYEIQ